MDYDNLIRYDEDFKIILDTDEKVIFQLREADGNIYEYVEIVTKLDNGNDLVVQEKYLINSNGIKEFITTDEMIIDNVLLDSIIASIDDTPDMYNSLATEGGSKLSGVYWKEYNDGMAHATSGTNSKYVKKNNDNYLEFKYITNSLKTMEDSLKTLGVLGVIDAVIHAIIGGEPFSLTLIKKVSGKMLLAIPGLGTLYQMYSYISTWLDARSAHEKI